MPGQVGLGDAALRLSVGERHHRLAGEGTGRTRRIEFAPHAEAGPRLVRAGLQARVQLVDVLAALLRPVRDHVGLDLRGEERERPSRLYLVRFHAPFLCRAGARPGVGLLGALRAGLLGFSVLALIGPVQGRAAGSAGGRPPGDELAAAVAKRLAGPGPTTFPAPALVLLAHDLGPVGAGALDPDLGLVPGERAQGKRPVFHGEGLDASVRQELADELRLYVGGGGVNGHRILQRHGSSPSPPEQAPFPLTQSSAAAPGRLDGPAKPETGRSDGLTWQAQDLRSDMTHPPSSGIRKVADQLLAFFKTDPTTTPWFLKPVSGAAPVLTASANPGSGAALPATDSTAGAGCYSPAAVR